MPIMNFKISEGPWKVLFSGVFQEQDVEIYINPESVLLVLIYEKTGGEVSGAVVELYKVLASVGELEEFVATLPREVIVLTKHTKKETIKYFLLASEPSYVAYKEDEFTGEVENLLKKIKTSAKMIKDVSKAYDLTLSDLHDTSPKIREAFFTQPLLIPVVSTASHPAYAAETAGTAAHAPQAIGITKGEVILGLTREGTQVVEPLEFMMKTLVVDGTEKDRSHALHLLIEGALLSNVAVTIFDRRDLFSGLAEGTKETEGLKKYKVDSEPIGFPVKNFDALRELVVDLNIANPAGLLQMFGAGEGEAAEIIKEKMQEGNIKDIGNLAERISKTKTTEKYNAYQILRAVRVMRLVGMRYPRMFDGANDIAEISKNWPKALGRAGIIKLGSADPRLGLMLLHNVILGMLAFYKAKGKSKAAVGIIVIPEAHSILPAESNSILAADVANALNELPMCGIGFAVSSARKLDLKKELAERAETNINIVKENDIGVAMRDRKAYRAFLRPGLSRCTEKG